jgi:hypothetical protein
MEFSNIDLKDLACFIYEILKSHGIEAILVGGACVSIYSHNRYQSYDLDFVTYEELKLIEKVLVKFGFKRIGRCFSHENCPYLIDFVNPPIAIGNASIRNFETLKTPMGSLQLLTPTDCVKDRLASFFHWNDQQALEQALLVAEEHSVDLYDIKLWAKGEGDHQKKMNIFLKKLGL